MGSTAHTSEGPAWAAPQLALRLSPITADELAAAALPMRKHGYDAASADPLLGRCLVALRLAEEQLADLHEALAAARSAAATRAPARAPEDTGVGAAVSRWLAAMSPERIDQLVSDVAARQVVDATLYAEATRREARDRVFVVVDLLGEAAQQLSRMVDAARGSLAGQHRLAEDLPSWQGRFHAAVAHAFGSLDLPPSAKAAALVTCATRELAGG